MIQYLLSLLSQTFRITLGVTLPILVIFGIGILCLFCISLVLLLNVFYRPRNLQGNLNIILDHLLSFLILISPYIIIIQINIAPIISMYNFLSLIGLHIIFVIPLIYILLNYRDYWLNTIDKKSRNISWKHPIVYFYIAMALLYVYLWGFYFSIIRFFQLGMETEIHLIILLKILFCAQNGVFLLFFLSIWHTFFIWGLAIFSFFIVIQKNIVGIFYVIIYSLHIQLLTHDLYSNTIEKVYKMRFILYNMVCLNAPLNMHKAQTSYNIIRRIINEIYYRPFILCILPLISIFMEVLIMHKLYFSFYILFFLPIFLSCCKILNALGITFFVRDVCLVDYKRQDLERIRYKPAFWKYIEDPELFYGFSIVISKGRYTVWEEQFIAYSIKNQLYSYNLSVRLFQRINLLQQKYPYSIKIYFARIKVAYHKTYHIRWNYKKTKYNIKPK